MGRRRDADRFLHAALQPFGKVGTRRRRRNDFQYEPIHRQRIAHVLLGDHRLELQHLGFRRHGTD